MTRATWSAAAFGAALLLSRLPLLGGGYGSDDDSWRTVVAVMHARELGLYVPSREPGFPAFEAVTFILLPFGPAVSNTAAVLAGCFAVALFHRIARRLSLPHAGWITAAFGFGAPLWVTASQTMDYGYAVAALLAAYDRALAGRPATSGALLALATGFRPTLAVLAPAFVLGLGGARGGVGRALPFMVAFGAAGALLFAPVLLSGPAGGASGFGHHVARLHATVEQLPAVLREAAFFMVGKLGLIVVASGLAVTTLRRRGDASIPGGAVAPLASRFQVALIMAVLGLYLLVPLEAAYLLPAVPFALLLVGKRLTRAWWIAVALAIASESLVLPLFGEQRVVPGRLFLERATRQRELEEVVRLAAAAPARPTVYEIGRYDVHRLLVLHPSLERTAAAWASFHEPQGVALWRRNRTVGYAAFLSASQRDSLRQRGFDIVIRPAGS
jgi:hypothetical protein